MPLESISQTAFSSFVGFAIFFAITASSEAQLIGSGGRYAPPILGSSSDDISESLTDLLSIPDVTEAISPPGNRPGIGLHTSQTVESSRTEQMEQQLDSAGDNVPNFRKSFVRPPGFKPGDFVRKAPEHEAARQSVDFAQPLTTKEQPIMLQGIDGLIQVLDTGKTPEGYLPAGQSNQAMKAVSESASIIYRYKGRVILGSPNSLERVQNVDTPRPATSQQQSGQR